MRVLHPPPPRRPGPRARRTAVALLGALAVGATLLVACSDDAPDVAGPVAAPGPTVAEAPPPSVIPAEDATVPTIPAPPGFVVPDTRNVRLSPVVGKERDEPDLNANLLVMEGGKATLRVTVLDVDGRPSPGATVRFERFVGPYRGWKDVVADDDGVATLRDAPGGRYRIRAWWRPSLATIEPQLVFVAFDQGVDLRVVVEQHDQPVLQGALTVPSWTVGETAAFEVLLLREEVTPDGLVVGTPIPGVAVTVSPIAGAAVEGDATGTTDGDGRLVLPVRCLVGGVHQGFLSGTGPAGEALWVSFELPDCLPSEAPPVEGSPPDGPAAPSFPGLTTDTTRPPAGGTTTTTRPGGSTTTSTTRPGETTTTTTTGPGVGGTFTVPTDGPVAAGRYQAVGGGAEQCATSFEVFRSGTWARQQADGADLVLAGPGRGFTAVEGSEPCTYRRVR